MYTHIRVYMALPTPTLYWRVKKESADRPGTYIWTWERAVASIMTTADVKYGVRHEKVNTWGYGNLGDMKYIQGDVEE
jgi:hypothetical protein